MNKDMSMEQEFERIKLEHKRQVIMYTLITFYEEGIYDHPLLKEYKNMEVKFLEGYENAYNFVQTKAFRVEEDLEERAENGEEDLFNQVYEMCWKKSRNRISEKRSFHG